MSWITPYIILDLIIILFLGLFSYYYLYFKLVHRKYWQKKNVPYDEPTFLIGNTDITFKTSFQNLIENFYFGHPNEKVVGVWMFTKPGLVIRDLEILKHVFIKDFNYFHDRGLAINDEVEPLTAHLFNLSGQRWRNLRAKLTPTFTSGKLKVMFETMLDVGNHLQNYLDKLASEDATVDVKELLAGFNTDIIASVAFGMETKSLGNPNSEFRRYGQMIFKQPFINILGGALLFAAPSLKKYIELRQLPKCVSDFFMQTVKDVIETREKMGTKRNDFMQLLIELKNKGYIEDVDHKNTPLEGDNEPFTLEQAAAQAFVFFFAGFETSSTTTTLALYELACNPELQDILCAEIDTMLEKDEGKLTYTNVQAQPYMEQVLQETLRKYAAVPVILRECTKDYKVPDMDLVIEKGTTILVSASGVQKDPKYFPNPEKFDPDRWTEAAKAERDGVLNLSFGAGPRSCIGNRFGQLQVKVGLAMILSKYRVEVAEETQIPLQFDPLAFLPQPIGGVPLKFTKR